MSRPTVTRGVAEVRAGAPAGGRVRAAGGGRKRLTETDPGLLAALQALVDPGTRGDPESPLLWTTKSTRHLADALTAAGHPISHMRVADLLHSLGYSLQGTAKTVEGKQHPDRDAQFGHINATASRYLKAGDPVISVDTKKKELVGGDPGYADKGREYQPKGEPVRVGVHDFPDPAIPKAVPYGIYDIAANTGWVSVGQDGDTAEFAVATLRRWWEQVGQADLPEGAAAADLRRRRRLQRLPGPAVETRTRRPGHRHRPGHHRLPLPARHLQVEPDRAPAVLRDHRQLARAAADQPPGRRRPHRRHQHPHRPDRARRSRHQHLPPRHQGQRRADGRGHQTTHPGQVPRRMELHGSASQETEANYTHVTRYAVVILLRGLTGAHGASPCDDGAGPGVRAVIVEGGMPVNLRVCSRGVVVLTAAMCATALAVPVAGAAADDGRLHLVSHTAGGQSADLGSERGSASNNGRWSVFASAATDLEPGNPSGLSRSTCTMPTRTRSRWCHGRHPGVRATATRSTRRSVTTAGTSSSSRPPRTCRRPETARPPKCTGTRSPPPRLSWSAALATAGCRHDRRTSRACPQKGVS